MPVRNLFLVRHGSVLNPSGLVYGRLPGFPLSPDGRREAAAAARHLAAFAVERLFSSPQERAQETAAIIADACGCPVVTDDRLCEAANLREGQVFVPAPDARSEIRLGRFKPFPEAAEDCDDIVGRTRGALERALLTTRRDVVLVSHQVPLALLLRNLGVTSAIVPDIREGAVVRIAPERHHWVAGFVPGSLARVEADERSIALLNKLRLPSIPHP